MTGTRTVPTDPTGHVDPVRHTVVRLGSFNLYLLAWFWACAVPVLVVATLVVARLTGPVDESVVLYARHAAIWFPFSQAVILVATYLRVHVAAGMTRRTFARATVVVAVGTGLAYGVVLTALAAVERAVHAAVGWDWRITESGLADASSPTWLLLAELLLCCVIANVGGLLVGVTYQRWGGLRATLALPLTAGPVLGAGAAGGWLPVGQSVGASAAPVLGTALVVTAVLAAAYVALVRRTPVRPPLA